MSFIRAGEQGSAIYAYPAETSDGAEVFICCGPPMLTKDDMRDHFREHSIAGDRVPDEAWRRLEAWDRTDEAGMKAEWDARHETGRSNTASLRWIIVGRPDWALRWAQDNRLWREPWVNIDMADPDAGLAKIHSLEGLGVTIVYQRGYPHGFLPPARRAQAALSLLAAKGAIEVISMSDGVGRDRTTSDDIGRSPHLPSDPTSAAMVRALADANDDRWTGTCGCGCDCSQWLRAQADQLEAQ